MLFNSTGFVVFYLLALLSYHFISKRHRSLLLLILSYILYSYFNVFYLFVLIAATLISYLLGLRLKGSYRGLILAFGIGLNLSLLAIFKYGYLICESLRTLNKGLNCELFEGLILPIGISFYILQAISYLVDVYKLKVAPEYNFIDFSLYLAFFPKLFSGPIERAGKLIPQIKSPGSITATDVLVAIKTIVWGYFCKLIIADKVSLIISPILDSYEGKHGCTLLLAIFLYSFQIYFDFYGYTRIAIGTAKLFGIDLTENFYQPYTAKSIKDFWHRWHVTLSTWVRDYLYIPLGGKNTNKVRFVINIMLVFLTSGLWHGASWNFLLWGGVHGFYYLLERVFEKPVGIIYRVFGIGEGKNTYNVIQSISTFCLVTFAWIAFRITDMSSLIDILKLIISNFGDLYSSLMEMGLMRVDYMLYLAILIVFFLLDSTKLIHKYIRTIPESIKQYILDLLILNVQLVLIFVIGGIGSREFIYFRF